MLCVIFEVERRSHMRSIDDILESLSDEDPDAMHPTSTENKTNSEDIRCFMDMGPSSSSANDTSATHHLPPTRHSTTGSFQEQLSSEYRTHDVAFRDSPPAGTDISVSKRPENSLCITQPLLKSTTEARDIPGSSLPENGIPVWEMFGVKLSEFCRSILASNAVALMDKQSHHGIHGSTTQNRDDHFSEETLRLSKSQSRSVPVERKVLGLQLAENQTKPVFPENTRIPISRERMGQQKAETFRPPLVDPNKPITLMSDGGGSPNPRPPIQPKGQATHHGTEILKGSGSPNIRPPLAPKPSLKEVKEERHMRGTTDVADQDPKASNMSGYSSVASLPRHRADAEASNSNSKFTPKTQISQVRRASALDSSEHRDSAWEPSEKDTLQKGTSSLDRGQNLVHWGPAVDRHFAEVRGENQRRRLEIKNPTITSRGGVTSTGILETHFNEPLSEAGPLQKMQEGLKPSQEPVSELPAINNPDRVKTGSIAFPTQSEVIRKKPPIAKEKPSWNPVSGAKGRGTPRASPALPSKTEHVEVGSKQNILSQPTINSEPQSTQSKPTLVRRARSQSSGRSDDAMISCEDEDISGNLFGATSAVQLSYSEELARKNSIQVAEQFPQSGIGRFQASAAKSEGLLTARKSSASPTGAGAISHNGGGREWRVRMPMSKSVDLLDAANNMEAMQRIGRRSLSKEWQVVTVTTKEEITILHRPAAATCITNPAVNVMTTSDLGFTNRSQLKSSKPFAV